MEIYFGGHFVCESFGKFRDLVVNIHEKCVTCQSFHLFDGGGGDFVEVHCHCPSTAETMAADRVDC